MFKQLKKTLTSLRSAVCSCYCLLFGSLKFFPFLQQKHLEMELLEKLGTEYSNYFHQADISKEVNHEILSLVRVHKHSVFVTASL